MIRSFLIILAALVSVSWDPVTRDCRGGLETPVAYEVLVYEARVIRYVTNADGQEIAIYSRTASYPRTAGTSIELVEPMPVSLNEVTYIGDPVAVDGAGNRSDETCN